MAQGEIFEIVISAVNKAAPALANTSKSLDLVQQSVVGLNASMQQTVGGVQFNANSFREVSAGIKEFHGRSKEWSGHLKVSHVEATKFASNIGGSVITALTRLAGPLAAATVSIGAFYNKLTSTKNLNELSRALGVPKELIKGVRRLGEEASVATEETDAILTDLFGKFEHMQFQSDRGDLWDKLYKIDDTRGLAITLAKIWDDVALGKISGEEGRKKSILETQKFLKEYNDVWKEPGTRLLLETGLGLSPKLAVLGRTPTDEFAKSISGLGKTTNDLDADQVDKFWKSWREFSRALGQFTTAVLTPLLPKITEFITRLTNDPRLMDFVNNVFPQLCKTIEETYFELKKAMEGAPLDWNKIFGGGLFERLFTDFLNQLSTRWQQILAATPFGSQEALNAARKAELQYRKDNLFGLSAEEEQELMNLEAGGSGAAGPIFMPKVSPEQEKDIIRRMNEYQQKQRFTSAGADDDALRIEVENTRALHDLTEQVKELNRKFSRATTGAGGETETIEGRQHGGPVYAGQKYLVGEGGPESFVARQQGGPVFPVGALGPQLFTPAQSGAIVPKMKLTPPKAVFPNLPSRSAVVAGMPPPGAQTTPGSVYGNLSEREGSQIPGGWRDTGDVYTKGPMKGQPLPQFTGAPRSTPGVSLPFLGSAGAPGQQKGGWVRVVNPRTGEPEYVQQVDIGPNMFNPQSQNKGIDINAALAEKWGYVSNAAQSKATGKPVFPTGAKIEWQSASEEEVIWSSFPTGNRETQLAGGPGFRGGRAAAEEGEAHLPSASENRAQIERLTGESGVSQQSEQQTAAVEGRQEGGPVSPVYRDMWGRELEGPAPPALPAPPAPPELRKIQRALEKTPENMEWQLRIERALKGVDGQSEFEHVRPPLNYGPGTGLPDPGYFKLLEKEFERNRHGQEEFQSRGRYDPDVRGPPDWFNPAGKQLEHPVNLAPGSLKSIENESPGYEATGSLNVNVRAPRGTSVKAEGTGPFETVNMSRKMTGDQQLGTG